MHGLTLPPLILGGPLRSQSRVRILMIIKGLQYEML